MQRQYHIISLKEMCYKIGLFFSGKAPLPTPFKLFTVDGHGACKGWDAEGMEKSNMIDWLFYVSMLTHSFRETSHDKITLLMNHHIPFLCVGFPYEFRISDWTVGVPSNIST